MPIDFNPNVQVCCNKIVEQPELAKHNSVYKFRPQTDTFSRRISADDYSSMEITKKDFGTIQKTGQKAELFTIRNKNGAVVELSSFGATIVSIKVPDKNGKLIDITQGYKNVTPYESAPVGHAGGTIGPCANKIAEGTFTIGGKEFKLECNKDNGHSHCHGGTEGFDVRNWTSETLPDGIKFTYLKKDMESGYPGNVQASVTYKFDNANRLHILYDAITDKDTVLNMTNHTYFNLDGAANTAENAVLDHVVKLPKSSSFTAINSMGIPTGEIINVEGTPFDLRSARRISDLINAEAEQLKLAAGFDHNYCIDGYDGKSMLHIAEVQSEKTGIKLNVYTNLPGFQFYTSNHLGKSAQPMGKSGTRYEKRSAFCIEPQFFPNAINTDSFNAKPLLRKGERYSREIIYEFSTQQIKHLIRHH